MEDRLKYRSPTACGGVDGGSKQGVGGRMGMCGGKGRVTQARHPTASRSAAPGGTHRRGQALVVRWRVDAFHGATR